MQFQTVRNGFEDFKCNFEPFERDSKHLNANSIHSKGIRSIQLQVQSIRKGFEAFECKFEPFKRDSKHSNANSNNSKGFLSVQNGNSNHWKGNGSIWIQIWILQTRFECKFYPFERNSKHSIANSIDSKGIRSILMQIRTFRKGFTA